jgi:hypothetical protein
LGRRGKNRAKGGMTYDGWNERSNIRTNARQTRVRVPARETWEGKTHETACRLVATHPAPSLVV